MILCEEVWGIWVQYSKLWGNRKLFSQVYLWMEILISQKFFLQRTWRSVPKMLCESTGFHLKKTPHVKHNRPQEIRASMMCYYPIVLNKNILWDEICPWNKTAGCDVSYLAAYHWSPAPTFRARSYAAELQMSLSWASSRTCSSSRLLCNSYNSRYSSKRLEEGKDNEICAPVFLIHIYCFSPNSWSFS